MKNFHSYLFRVIISLLVFLSLVSFAFVARFSANAQESRRRLFPDGTVSIRVQERLSAEERSVMDVQVPSSAVLEFHISPPSLAASSQVQPSSSEPSAIFLTFWDSLTNVHRVSTQLRLR